MIDIETLGKKPGAVVLSVGLAVMDMEELKIVETAHWKLNLKEQEHANIDPETVIWWMQQSSDARAVFNKLMPETMVDDFYRELVAVFKKYDTRTPWANGTNFDLPILGQYMYSHSNWNSLPNYPNGPEDIVPWNYRWQDMRSLATMMADILPYSTFVTTGAPVAHNALDDAVRQAEYVLEVKKWIRARSRSTPA
jgi:hypothetical protein